MANMRNRAGWTPMRGAQLLSSAIQLLIAIALINDGKFILAGVLVICALTIAILTVRAILRP